MQNGVGRTGSAPPANTTSAAWRPDEPAIDRMLRSASLDRVMISFVSSPTRGNDAQQAGNAATLVDAPRWDYFTAKPALEYLKLAGESVHFGLRQRSPMPAIRPFDLMPRLRSMLDQANAALAQPFRGVSSGIIWGPLPARPNRHFDTIGGRGGSIPARQADPEATPGGVLFDRRRCMAKMVEHPPLADAARRLPRGSCA